MRSAAPDISELPLPIDAWTQPFWDAASRRELTLPRCAACGTWRWPPTPFCPKCRSQALDWLPAGEARLYSFTIVRRAGATPEDPDLTIVPALVEFPGAGHMRLPTAIVDSEIEAIRIGNILTVAWTAKNGTNVPVFKVP